jgi:hypothetical protein
VLSASSFLAARVRSTVRSVEVHDTRQHLVLDERPLTAHYHAWTYESLVGAHAFQSLCQPPCPVIKAIRWPIAGKTRQILPTQQVFDSCIVG